MTPRRPGLSTAALALIAVGVVVVLHAGIGTSYAVLKYVWPLVLIGVGVEVTLGALRPGGVRPGGWSLVVLVLVVLGSVGVAIGPSVAAVRFGTQYAEPVHGRLRVGTSIRAVEIAVRNTPVTVTGTASADLSYRGRLMAEASSQAAAAGAIRVQWSVRRQGHTLVMSLTAPRGAVVTVGNWLGAMSQPATHLTVLLPAALASRVVTTNAGVRVTGMAGAVDVQTTNAGVRVADGGASVVVRTSNGGVTLNDIAGTVRVYTTNGGVTGLSPVGGDWRVATSNAAVTLRLAPATSARISASTTNGAIGGNLPWAYANGARGQATARIGAGAHRIAIATTNGNVTVTAAN